MRLETYSDSNLGYAAVHGKALSALRQRRTQETPPHYGGNSARETSAFSEIAMVRKLFPEAPAPVSVENTKTDSLKIPEIWGIYTFVM